MEAIDELAQLSDSMRQAAAVLADEDLDETFRSSRRNSTFMNVVALGNTGAGKSAVLNSLIGHPALPTGEGGATRAPICIDLKRDDSLSSKSIVLQIDSKSQPVSASALRHSLQDRLSKNSSKNDEIYLKLRTSTAPPLKLVDLPGVEKEILGDSLSQYAEHSDAILLVIIPASKAPDISSAKALRIAKEYDGESTRTIGVISKIDQASSEPKVLAAVQALLLNQGPRSTSDIPWVALIGQSVSIASAQSGSVGSDNSLETAWRAESESLKSILVGAPQSKLGRLALVETLAQQIRKRMSVRLPNLLSGLQDKSQVVKDELVKLGEQMVTSSEGTKALALELCREFEDRFLQHITTGEGSGWKVVASFEGNFPNRIKQLPLDRHFDINNVKRVVLEADGYQPYLISPEKGLRSLIKGVLDMAKEPSRLCVDEVHRVLVDIVSASANATPGLGRYPPFKREVVAIATTALDGFKTEAKNMVVALVDMERVFVPPQHFIRLVQRRMDRQRREDELKNRGSKRAVDAEQSSLNRATSPQTGGQQQSGGALKSLKDKLSRTEKDSPETPALKTAGSEGEITAGFLLKKSTKTDGWSRKWFVLNEKTGKLGYTKKQEERHFRGVSHLTSCCSYGLPWFAECTPCPPGLEAQCPTIGRSGNYKNFQCQPGHYNDLASLFLNPNDDAIRNLFSSSNAKEFRLSSLFIFFAAMYLLGIITYGIAVPAGLFIPVILAGASYGRVAGTLFSSISNLNVGLFALLGAASFLGGTMRMTVSLCVILLELTNNLLMLPLVMLVLLVSKTVADSFNKGVYDQIVMMKGLPYLEAHAEPYMRNLVAGDVVSGPLIEFSAVERVGNIYHALKMTRHHGFPVIDEPPFASAPELCGLVLRSHLLVLLNGKRFTKQRELSGKELLSRFQASDFAKAGSGKGLKLKDLDLTQEEMEMFVDLHPITNTSPYTVVETMSLAKAAVLFREVGLRHLCVVPKSPGRPPIVGILTRHDFMPEHILGLYPQINPHK